MNLQIFLQFYKEKLMLTRKVQDSLSKHVVTMDALKKAKEGYSDQFQLDFEQLFKVFINEQEKKAQGHRNYIPEDKPKPVKKNLAKEKRERMVSYGRKVTGFTPLDFGLQKLDVRKIDHDDFKYRDPSDISDFGKLIAFKRGKLLGETKQI